MNKIEGEDNQIRKDAQIEIYKSISDRKKVGMIALKEWDQSSRQNLLQMKNLIEGMFDKLNLVFGDSTYRYEKINKFFTVMKINFSSDFSFKEHIPKFQFGEIKSDQKDKNPADFAATALGNYIESIEKELVVFQTSINNFQKQIDQNIIAKILNENVKTNDTKLKQLFSQKNELRENIRKLSRGTKDSFDHLVQNLYNALTEKNRCKRPTTNFFQFVFIFVNNVRKLALHIREYGNYFVEIFKTAKSLEKDRLNATRDAFFEFNGLMERTFSGLQIQGLKNSELSLRKIQSSVWNADFFDPKAVLTPEQSELILKKSGSTELTIEIIKDFIDKEKIEENIKEFFDHFVLRRFLVKESDHKKAAKNDIIIYLTIDYYYSIYLFDKETKKHAVLANVPIEQMRLVSKANNVLVFVFEESGILWNSKKKLSFLFPIGNDEELKTEHENYLSLLRIDVINIGNGSNNSGAKKLNPELKNENVLKTKQEIEKLPFGKLNEIIKQEERTSQGDDINEIENRNLAYSQTTIDVCVDNQEIQEDLIKKGANNNDSLN